jgi:hypothetical protein
MLTLHFGSDIGTVAEAKPASLITVNAANIHAKKQVYSHEGPWGSPLDCPIWDPTDATAVDDVRPVVTQRNQAEAFEQLGDSHGQVDCSTVRGKCNYGVLLWGGGTSSTQCDAQR